MASGLNPLPQKFECEYKGRSCRVTRKALTKEDQEWLEKIKEKREMRKNWLRTFGFDA